MGYFFRAAAIICNAPHCNLVREVVNPNKDQKPKEVALRHQIDPMEFKRVGCYEKYGYFFRKEVLSVIVRLSHPERDREDAKATANGLTQIS